MLGCHCTVPKLKTKRHQSGTAGVTDVKDHKHQVATSLYKHQMATSLYRHQWPHHCTGIRWPHHCTHIRWPHHCTHIRWPYHCTNINGHIIVQTPVATSLYRHQVATSLNRHQWPHHCTHIRWPHHNSLVFSSQSALHKGTCQHETHTRTHIQSLTSLNMHSFATEEILAARVQSPKLAHRQVPS